MLSCSIWFSAPSFWMGGGLESRCVSCVRCGWCRARHILSQHPSSGVLKTVTAASGTGHNIGTAPSLQRGPIGPRWREVTIPVL